MLFLKTVEPRTFSILKELLEIPELKDFSLVGVTALSLLYGHRKSVDLDLFSPFPFENEVVVNCLSKKFGSQFLMEEKPPHFGVFSFIDDVKVDFVRHPHPLIREIEHVEGVRMFSTPDIIAMKVQAVLGRGKKKDFWDIAELLNHYRVNEFIQFHQEKYFAQNLMITVPQAITYFADAEEGEDPISLKGQSWMSVKKKIMDEVSNFLK